MRKFYDCPISDSETKVHPLSLPKALQQGDDRVRLPTLISLTSPALTLTTVPAHQDHLDMKPLAVHCLLGDSGRPTGSAGLDTAQSLRPLEKSLGSLGLPTLSLLEPVGVLLAA